jgi:hypothetical protein
MQHYNVLHSVKEFYPQKIGRVKKKKYEDVKQKIPPC